MFRRNNRLHTLSTVPFHVFKSTVDSATGEQKCFCLSICLCPEVILTLLPGLFFTPLRLTRLHCCLSICRVAGAIRPPLSISYRHRFESPHWPYFSIVKGISCCLAILSFSVFSIGLMYSMPPRCSLAPHIIFALFFQCVPELEFQALSFHETTFQDTLFRFSW